MPATLPKHFYRVQGYVDPPDHHTLYDIFFPAWGAQTRIIRALHRALAEHVRTHYDPHTPADERDAELEDILSRVTFGRPMRSRGQRNGQPAAARAPGNHPFPASGCPQERSEPRSALGEHPDAETSPEGHPDAKEAQATAS